MGLLAILVQGEGGIREWMLHWLGYPGLEVWKFLNLTIFIIVGFFILRRPLGDALQARREAIKRELRQAQAERDQALAKLSEVETRLARLDSEIAAIRQQSMSEAQAERERLSQGTQTELEKIKEFAIREIESSSKAAKHELQEFAAYQSLRLAEDIIRNEIRPEDDARLISASVEQLRGSAG
jgi:F0F1-type ATP synthase membrane subunit b/b'